MPMHRKAAVQTLLADRLAAARRLLRQPRATEGGGLPTNLRQGPPLIHNHERKIQCPFFSSCRDSILIILTQKAPASAGGLFPESGDLLSFSTSADR
jgi:hypothetical protein